MSVGKVVLRSGESGKDRDSSPLKGAINIRKSETGFEISKKVGRDMNSFFQNNDTLGWNSCLEPIKDLLEGPAVMLRQGLIRVVGAFSKGTLVLHVDQRNIWLLLMK
jgi:hypothetical protein